MIYQSVMRLSAQLFAFSIMDIKYKNGTFGNLSLNV
jgi:hypothetical protein